MVRLLAAAAVVAASLAAPALAGTPARVGYPSSIGVIGDSFETGFATNRTRPPIDVPANDWVTGTNPAIQSHYLRILAENPAIRGHAYRKAQDGAGMVDFAGQVDELPRGVGYIVEALGADDMCTGEPLAKFRRNALLGMRELARTQPDARVLMVGIGGIEAIWNAAGPDPVLRASVGDAGPCDPKFDADGVPSPAAVAALHAAEARYNGGLQSVCARSVHCRWDGVAYDTLHLVGADLAPLEPHHPSPSGQAKVSAALWAATFDFTDTSAPVSRATRAGGTVTLSATDPEGVAGIEYRFAAKGPWTRYAKPLAPKKGTTLTWRAVDVNGNVEASHSLRA
ncbi:MAG TPA: hypothetical protein VFJ91_08760 [Gaiellaceae bacterium]|nr:hypothetical protein [Gaiellaceae bacterium]